MAEPIHLGPKPSCSCRVLSGDMRELDEACPIHGKRNPRKIFKAALRVFEMGEYDCEEAVDIAQELWDRAHGWYKEDEEDSGKLVQDLNYDETSAQGVPVVPERKFNVLETAVSVCTLTLILAGCGYLAVKHFTAPNVTCAIIHRPSSGCPQGYYQESAPRFIEKDHTLEYACVSTDPSKPMCTDVLKAGEQEMMQFTIPQSAPDNDRDPIETNRSKVKSKL